MCNKIILVAIKNTCFEVEKKRIIKKFFKAQAQAEVKI